MAALQIVVEGVRNPHKLPGLSQLDGVELTFVKGAEQLTEAITGVPVMLGFGYRDHALEAAWHQAQALEWVQWCAAGVDSLLFPALVESDVIVTNAAGIFDDAIAEWVLGMAVWFCKDFSRSSSAQRSRTWKFFPGRSLAGTSAAILGAGSIGRAVARLLQSTGVDVTLYGTHNRPDAEFGTIHQWDPAHECVAAADWVVAVLPNVPAAQQLIDGETFASMKPEAVFMNVGRGDSVVETDLQYALTSGTIAGAALDVVQNEPLDGDSAWWDIPNLVLTPHNSGDVGDSAARIIELFVDNVGRWRAGQPLRNVVDKRRGY